MKPAGRAKRSSKSKLSKSTPLSPIDYKLGGEKRWWIKHDQTNFKQFYMRALLKAETIATPIPHGKSETYYERLLKGEDPTKARKQRFAFDGAVKLRVPRRRQRKAARASAISSYRSADHSDDLSDEESSSTSSTSSSQTTSSSSSGSDSSEKPPKVRESEKPAVPVTSGASDKPAEVHPSAAIALPRTLLDTTLAWKSFRFTEVKTLGVAVGYEVNCFIAAHTTAGKCTRSMRFAKHGGRELAEHKLKCWAVAGFDEAVRSQMDHSALPWDLEPRPSLEELEAFQVPLDRVRALKRKRE